MTQNHNTWLEQMGVLASHLILSLLEVCDKATNWPKSHNFLGLRTGCESFMGLEMMATRLLLYTIFFAL